MRYFQTILFSSIVLLSLLACNISNKSNINDTDSKEKAAISPILNLDSDNQIGQYIVEIFEDSKGNLWFGTMSKGVARYDGKSLVYFTTADGLPSNGVGNIIEDKKGNLWMATHAGLSKYDGKTFTNFTKNDGLCHNRVSNLLIDSNGTLWVGTWGGVSLYNGSTFSDFLLPIPEVDTPDYVETKEWITEIMEDKQGNIWIGRSGYGACKYLPASREFINFTKKEGLPSNCVQTIYEDQKGNIWFTSRVAERDNPDPSLRFGEGGLTKFDGKTMVQFPEVIGLNKTDVYSIYGEKSGNIWIGATGVGLYQYDGKSFKLFSETDRMDLTAKFGVQSILEDKNGTLWLGFSGGLFRMKGSAIINVTENGPWK